jgi:hypothetical protein
MEGGRGKTGGVGFSAYGFDLLVFASDVVAEVFLQPTHCDYGVVADSLDHLQGGKKTIVMNALQNLV